jgi:hypothetical protein
MLKFPPPRRHDAISTDAEERRVGRWLALDDDVEGWPANRRHLLVAPKNPWQGLSQLGLADELSAALELLCTDEPLEVRLPVETITPSTVDLSFRAD